MLFVHRLFPLQQCVHARQPSQVYSITYADPNNTFERRECDAPLDATILNGPITKQILKTYLMALDGLRSISAVFRDELDAILSMPGTNPRIPYTKAQSVREESK